MTYAIAIHCMCIVRMPASSPAHYITIYHRAHITYRAAKISEMCSSTFNWYPPRMKMLLLILWPMEIFEQSWLIFHPDAMRLEHCSARSSYLWYSTEYIVNIGWISYFHFGHLSLLVGVESVVNFVLVKLCILIYTFFFLPPPMQVVLMVSRVPEHKWLSRCACFSYQILSQWKVVSITSWLPDFHLKLKSLKFQAYFFMNLTIIIIAVILQISWWEISRERSLATLLLYFYVC